MFIPYLWHHVNHNMRDVYYVVHWVYALKAAMIFVLYLTYGIFLTDQNVRTEESIKYLRN